MNALLKDRKIVPKTYWAILKTFVNGSKIPLIPPLLVDNKLVTDFLDKANLLNNFSAEQGTPVSNYSTVPLSINLVTRERLPSWNFVLMILLRLLSIRMTKLCASSIWKQLHLIFRNCLETESFPKEWKKAKIIPVHCSSSLFLNEVLSKILQWGSKLKMLFNHDASKLID